MSAEDPSVTSEAALQAELQELLCRAYDSGIDVEGGWDCRNGVDHPDWDVIVTEVQKTDGSEHKTEK